MPSDDRLIAYVESLLTEAEKIRVTSEQIAARLQKRVNRLRTSLILSAVGIVAVAVLAIVGFQYVRGENRTLLCDGFVPISQSKVTAMTSQLGHEIVDWARHGADHLNCPARPPSAVRR